MIINIKKMSDPYLDFNAIGNDLCITCIDLEIIDCTWQAINDLYVWFFKSFENECAVVKIETHKAIWKIKVCVKIDGMGYTHKAIKQIKTIKKAFYNYGG